MGNLKAMPGPAPKRAPTCASAEQGLDRSHARGRADAGRSPALPVRRDAEGNRLPWHARTQAWWRNRWHSPMAAEYLLADVDRLLLVADLIDRYWRELSVALAAEIRPQDGQFGGTPMDRRRLNWRIAHRPGRPLAARGVVGAGDRGSSTATLSSSWRFDLVVSYGVCGGYVEGAGVLARGSGAPRAWS